MPVTSSVGVALIEAYQRHLSPRKGFRCAYGVMHGNGTCSSIGKRIMRDQGILKFLQLMPRQFAACRTAAITLNGQLSAKAPSKHVPRKRACEYGMLFDDIPALDRTEKVIECSCVGIQTVFGLLELISACG